MESKINVATNRVGMQSDDMQTKYPVELIAEILTKAGCEVESTGYRVYVNKTPNGARGHYGFCVAGDDVRDVTDRIIKRNGEISAILRAA